MNVNKNIYSEVFYEGVYQTGIQEYTIGEDLHQLKKKNKLV